MTYNQYKNFIIKVIFLFLLPRFLQLNKIICSEYEYDMNITINMNTNKNIKIKE